MGPNPTTDETLVTNPGTHMCPYCHQAVLSTYYYCPNCGTKLDIAPLSTSVATQAWIYLLSIILPMFLFLFISKWPGWKYYKSADPNLRQIGVNAIALLVLSTLFTIWLTYEFTQSAIQSVNSSINADLGSM